MAFDATPYLSRRDLVAGLPAWTDGFSIVVPSGRFLVIGYEERTIPHIETIIELLPTND